MNPSSSDDCAEARAGEQVSHPAHSTVAPKLENLITPYHRSRLRLERWMLWSLDLWGSVRGWPRDWRCSEKVRQDNRRLALEARPDRGDLWVFGYGSLMWDPGLVFEEVRHATIRGYERSLCQQTSTGRGSVKHPALLFALKTGQGSCHGLAFRIKERDLDRETSILWRREMIQCSYLPTWVQIETPQEHVVGLTFIIDEMHPEYRAEQSIESACLQIARAHGTIGSNRDYVNQLGRQLERLSISDNLVQRVIKELQKSQPERAHQPLA